jgi:hypothetical protein
MNVTRAMIPETTVRADIEASKFMEKISKWIGPYATLAVMSIQRGKKNTNPQQLSIILIISK